MKYSIEIMQKLRKCRRLDENDTSEDDQITNMSPDEVFEHILKFDGLLGNWDYYIKEYVKEIYGVKLGEDS
jgi:hypothetical protein